MVTYTCIFNYNFSKKKVNTRLKCLVFYLLFLKYSLSSVKNINFSFFFKDYRKNIIVITRAPYRYKLSRHQFFFSRYCLVFQFFFSIPQLSWVSLASSNKLMFFFCFADFCFFSVHFYKLSVAFRLLEWLR